MTSLLNTQHPRLFINPDKILQMKALARNDSFFRLLFQNLMNRADELLNARPVEFNIVGPRMLKNCQEIHSRVTTLALVFLLTDDNKYASRAILELQSASNYPHWNKDHFLDTAELITAFAIGYDWLFHFISSNEKKIITQALVKKGLEVGLEEHAKNIWWAAHKFNWNQVCNGGLIIGALAIADEDPLICRRIFDATVKYLPISFNSYGKDGGWEGGPDYWAYTTWYSVLLVEALLSNTGDDFGLSKTEGFDQTGLFPIYNAGSCGKQFNFADADDDDVHKAYPTLFWLGNHFGIDASINHNHHLLKISIHNKQPFDAFNLIWYTPAISNNEALPVNRIFTGIDSGYFRETWDQKSMSVAFKGGYNLADHAHLDMGSFVFDYYGVRWASDLGRDDYDLPDYFQRTVEGNRWNYFRLNTKSHNTLLLNEEIQQVDAKAKIIDFKETNDSAFAVVDLSEAYATHAYLVLRTFKLIMGNRLVVSDKIKGKESLTSARWQMLTGTEVDVAGRVARLSQESKEIVITIVKPANVNFAVISAEQSPPEKINQGYKLLYFEINEFDDTNEFEVEFNPR